MRTFIYALALLFAGAAVVVVAQGSLPPTQGVATYYWSGSAWVPVTSSGGGGGGGAVTVADGADVTQGAIADTAYASGGGTVVAVLKGIFGKLNAALTVNLPTGASTAANQTTGNSSLATIATNTGAAVPAGTAVIGKVGIDQTTPGTTNGVQINAALPAGTALIGKVGIDQTTPGTTNGVVVNSSALPSGAATSANQGTPYPPGATPITASATGTTAATTATLAASASIKTYICGFSIRANATAAATANSTVTGTITGTLNYTQWTAPNASGIGLTEQIFSPCIPSSAINTGIAVISAAPGSGGVVSVSAWGFQL